MKKTVVFDMDGVIFDTEQMVLSCWKVLAGKYQLEGIEEVFRQCIGTNLQETEQIVKRAYGSDFPFEKFRKESSELFAKKQMESGIPVKCGTRQLLSYLKVNNYQIGLATSTRREKAEAELEEAGLLRFFHEIVCGDEIERSKPNPEIYQKVCQKLGVSPEDAYAIEDSFHGVESAYRAGMKVFMVPDLLEPDDRIREMAQDIYPSLMAVLGYMQNE